MKKSFFFLAGLLLLSACGEQQAQQAETEYKTLVVSLSDRTLNTEYTAKLRGRQYVEIRPQVSGLITEIRINEGDAVHKGQILFVIDQVPYKAALETAIANVKSAEAQLATAKLTADSKEQLYKENIVSDFDLQSARNTLAAAEAALAQASAQEINARNNLSYTEVKSPVDGVASMIQYRVGALVSSSITEPLVTVADTEQMHAYLSLSEVDILDLIQQYGSLDAAIAQMPDVSLKMINGADYPHKGRIDAISGTVEESTLNYIIRDHDRSLFEKKKAEMLRCAEFINGRYGAGTVELTIRDQYYNMREQVEPHYHVVEKAVKAMEMAGVEPHIQPIRGGTDGANLSFKGLPCPNIFAGGLNFHGKYEWVSVQSMEKASAVILNIIRLYAEQ